MFEFAKLPDNSISLDPGSKLAFEYLSKHV